MNSHDDATLPDVADRTLLEVVVVNFNGARLLPHTLKALRLAGVRAEQIIVSDDGSTDGSADAAERTYPGLRVLRREKNCGKVNMIRNNGLGLTKAKFVFLTDNDIDVGKGRLERMIAVLQQRTAALAVTPRLLEASNPEQIFADGNSMHFLGLSGESARGRPATSMPMQPLRPTFGGGIMMVNGALAKQIGGLDSSYIEGWASDAEFQLRARLLGYQALHDSRIAMIHVGKDHGTTRALGQMSNRYRLILTYYTPGMLVLLAPSLLIFELLLTIAAIRMGLFRIRMRALWSIAQNWQDIRRQRQRLQSLRKRSDLDIMHGGQFELPGTTQQRTLARIMALTVGLVFEVNWRLVLLFTKGTLHE